MSRLVRCLGLQGLLFPRDAEHIKKSIASGTWDSWTPRRQAASEGSGQTKNAAAERVVGSVVGVPDVSLLADQEDGPLYIAGRGSCVVRANEAGW